MRRNHIVGASYGRSFITTFCLLACIAFSSAATATTFTLAELDRDTGTVAGFTIGNVEFFDFDIVKTTANAALITIDTVDSNFVPGFVVNGNGQWSVCFDGADCVDGVRVTPEELDFSYQVRTVDGQALIGGASLLASDYSIENGTALNLTLDDGGTVGLGVTIFEPFGLPITNSDIPSDSANLNPRVDSLMLVSGMDLSLAGDLGPQGPGSVNSYTMLFPVVVPEPGTAALLGLGLVGLGCTRPGRGRGREESEGTA